MLAPNFYPDNTIWDLHQAIEQPAISSGGLYPSTPKVINFKFLLQPHQKHYITEYEELSDFHYLKYMFLFGKVGRMHFLNLVVKEYTLTDPL